MGKRNGRINISNTKRKYCRYYPEEDHLPGAGAGTEAVSYTHLDVYKRQLIDIGLGYLSLDRGLSTLSGGEIQRCKIAKCLNSSLSDLLYILDEPSAGLHNHDRCV